MDGEGLLDTDVVELPPGCVTQPAAKIERAVISPRVEFLIVLIAEFLGC
jgi:hypothetical protein